MEHFPQLHFLFSRAPNLFHLLVLLDSPSADGEILARSEEGVSLPGLPSVAQLGVRNAVPRAPSIWWGPNNGPHKTMTLQLLLVRAPWPPPRFPSSLAPCALTACGVTLTGDLVLCLALYLALQCSEIVPLYDDFESKAPLAFSEHMASGCIMFNYKPVFDGWTSPF